MTLARFVLSRWRACVLLAALEQGASWCLAHFAVAALAAPLAAHPEGPSALASEGGRLALDLLLRHPDAVRAAALTLALGALLYLAALAPLRALPAAVVLDPSPHLAPATLRALSVSPRVLLLSAGELALQGAALWLGSLSVRAAWRLAQSEPSMPRVALALCASALPGLALCALTAALFDAALLSLVERRGAQAALGDAATRLRRRPAGVLSRSLAQGCARALLGVLGARLAVSAAPWPLLAAASFALAVSSRGVRLAWLRWLAAA